MTRFLRIGASGTIALEDDWLDPRREGANFTFPAVVFTGRRMLAVTWERAGTGFSEDSRIRITSGNFDGTDVRELDVPAPYAQGGNVSSYGDRVAIRSFAAMSGVSPVGRRTDLIVLDAFGVPEAEHRDVDLPYTRVAHWIARPDAIRFWNTPTSSATERYVLSWTGERTEGPTLFE
ncbi:MAG: hypothetical protein AAGH15_08160, partial [Myxococcota bacterium]